MKTHIVIDGNAFYEIDEECMRQKMENEQKKIQKKQRELQKKRPELEDRQFCSQRQCQKQLWRLQKNSKRMLKW